MATKKDQIVWTGKNLAAVKAFHTGVAHHPRAKGDDSYRSADQHPDNLHITTEEGHTLVAALGDTLVRDRLGRVWVQETASKRPTASGRFGPGRVIDASAGERRREGADHE